MLEIEIVPQKFTDAPKGILAMIDVEVLHLEMTDFKNMKKHSGIEKREAKTHSHALWRPADREELKTKWELNIGENKYK